MEKIDLKKEYKNLYSAKNEPAIVNVPAFNYLMVDGRGDPNTSETFQTAIELLYSTAYTIKFMSKAKPGKDFVVPPLEGLWWAEDMNNFIIGKKDEWLWTLIILQPEFITKEMFLNAIEKVKTKKSTLPIEKIRFEKLHEGKSAQIMHTGPFADEGPTIQKLHAFIKENGFKPNKKHHEIYLSDFRKTAKEKLKTIIRQPVI